MLEERAKEPNNNATQENTTEKQQQMAQEHPNKQPQTDRECNSAANTRQKLSSTIFGRNRTTTENRAKQTTKPDNLSTMKTKTKGGRKTLTLQVCFQHRSRGSFLSVLVC